jgi:hypothetical protein
MLEVGTVSKVVAVPVVKLVELTVAVHCAARLPRVSVTVTAPSGPDRIGEPTVALPRLAVDGWEMLSAPALRLKVALVAADAWGVTNASAEIPTTTAGMSRRKQLPLPRMI